MEVGRGQIRSCSREIGKVGRSDGMRLDSQTAGSKGAPLHNTHSHIGLYTSGSKSKAFVEIAEGLHLAADRSATL